jgi:integrase
MARGARWDEIDLKAKLWAVPPSRMKRSSAHWVPLSSETVKLIERLPRKGGFLFTVNGNGRPIVVEEGVAPSRR